MESKSQKDFLDDSSPRLKGSAQFCSNPYLRFILSVTLLLIPLLIWYISSSAFIALENFLLNFKVLSPKIATIAGFVYVYGNPVILCTYLFKEKNGKCRLSEAVDGIEYSVFNKLFLNKSSEQSIIFLGVKNQDEFFKTRFIQPLDKPPRHHLS